MFKDESRSKENSHKFAIELLNLIYKNRYLKLQDLDCPDLQDKQNRIGVEVTKAVNFKIEQSLTAFQKRKMSNRNMIQFNDNRFIQFKEEDFEQKIIQIKNAYLDKVEKLNNGNYNSMEIVDLLIFSSINTDIDFDILLNILKTEKDKNFRFVYIVGYKYFYEIDLKSCICKKINYLNNEINYKEVASQKCRFFWV